MPKIFLDANILLEIILDRPKQHVAIKHLEKQPESLYISSLTAHLVVYFGQSRVGLPTIRNFLADYTILPLEESDFTWAFTNARNKDFEDALQLGVAIRHACTQFVTFDSKLSKDYRTLPTITVTHLQ